MRTSAPSNTWSAVASSADGAKLVAVAAPQWIRYGTNIDYDSVGEGSIYRSLDSGATWTQTVAPTNHWASIASSADGTKLVAASPGAGIFTSSNSAATWRQTGKLLLDKNPSLTVQLPVWLRVFPELHVVIALRDPRDVVLSCYFQNILLNATNVNFLSLERLAKHYADLMDVWLAVREAA